jgi:hypothetical protein
MKVGQIVLFEGSKNSLLNDEVLEQTDFTQIAAIFGIAGSGDEIYVITHSRGIPFGELIQMDIKLPSDGYEVLQGIQDDPRKFTLARPNEINNIDFTQLKEPVLKSMDLRSRPFNLMPLNQRLYVAVLLKDNAYLGDLILDGEIAPIETNYFNTLQDDHFTLLKTVQLTIHAVIPMMDKEGKDLLADYVIDKEAKLEDGWKKIKMMGLIKMASSAMMGGMKNMPIMKLLQKADWTLFQQVDYMKLIEIGKENNIPIDEFVEFAKEFNLLPSENTKVINISNQNENE